MGLDMFLKARVYLSAWSHTPQDKRALCNVVLAAVDVPLCEDSPSVTVEATVGYWRKANAVHGWFVRHVQGGTDNCKPHEVSREKLAELGKLCEESARTQTVHDELRPCAGFFFGSTEINAGYWADLLDTVQIVKLALSLPADVELFYLSSW